MVEAVVAHPFAGIGPEQASSPALHAEALSPRRRFENLLDRHEAKLRRVAFGMLGDPNAVDDVLQEAFLRAYRKLPSHFENERVEAAWIYRIVHRCCLNELRARGRRREMPGLDELRAAATDKTDASLGVVVSLAALPPQARAVVLLVDLIGFDYETAASILRVPRGTVASRLNAARAQLRAAFAQAEEDRDE